MRSNPRHRRAAPATILLALFFLASCAGDRSPAAPANNPPNAPWNPVPADGTSFPDTCSCIFYLAWDASDPDPGDSLTFDVHLGTSDPPPLAAADRTQRYFIPALPDSGATYYWYIVARDRSGASTAGPVWRFAVESGP